MLDKFYITAGEMRQAGIRCHEEIVDHTKYRPPSLKALLERVGIAINLRNSEEADGKDAEQRGDTHLAAACLRSVQEIDEVIAIWRERWRQISRESRNV